MADSSMANTEKKIKKEIYLVIVPIILENVLETSAGLVTTAMVGRLLAADISAQGISIRITDLFMMFCKGVAIGATVFIARSYGAGKAETGRKILEHTMVVQLLLAAVIQGLLLVRPELFLRFFSKDPAILSLAESYIRIVAVGCPFLVIITLVAAAFQGYGNTRVPMYIAGLMNVINIVCGYVLIFGLGPVPAGGIKGAAAALVIAQGSAAFIGLWLLYRKKKGLFSGVGRTYRLFPPDRRCLYEVYTTGVPAALENMFWTFSAMILSRIILSYGTLSFAAYQLGIQAEAITEMPGYGFSTASTTLTAKAMGKGDEALRKTYFKEQIKIALAISSVTSLVLILFPGVFMRLMTDKREIQAIGVVYVFIMGFLQLPQNLSRILNGSIRALGYKNTSLVVTGLGIWLIRIPFCLLASYVFHLPILAIWLIIAADQIFRFCLSACLYRRVEKKRYAFNGLFPSRSTK